jgi:hypothetical protein
MFFADFLIITNKASNFASRVIYCSMLLALPFIAHAAPPETDKLSQSSELILSLPDRAISSNDQNWLNTSLHPDDIGNSKQLIANNKKKLPVNLDCGMDLYQNTTPDTPLSSRLTGECDFKYHY